MSKSTNWWGRKHATLSSLESNGTSKCRSLLPPANVVYEGYIFTGVCDSVNRGACMVWFWGVCMVLFGGACMVWFGGVCGFIWGREWFYSGRGGRVCVVLFRGGVRGFFSFFDTMRYGQWAGGTHPTGMPSCFFVKIVTCGWRNLKFSVFWRSICNVSFWCTVRI